MPKIFLRQKLVVFLTTLEIVFVGNTAASITAASIVPIGCQDPLGMENGEIADQQINASSELSPNHAAIQGRLNFLKSGTKEGAWVAANVIDQWFQISLGNQTRVTGVATQGRNGFDEWVTKYHLQYSNYGVYYNYYIGQGQISKKVFSGNTDKDTVVYHQLNPPISARYIRFRPLSWYKGISLRVELYGCFRACQGPLGMENGGISDGKISASTELNGHLAIQGRLHFPASSIAGGWAAAVNDENQWLQIDLGNKFAYVTGVATQGRDLVGQWVTKYDLYYGDDGVSFTFYKNVTGNTDWGTVVYHELKPPITARYIRFRPVTWNGHIAMRVELYGCIEDEEECENGTHNCALHAHCINTFGSFYCTCAHGYSGDGVQCSDIDECQTGIHGCDENAKCVNDVGSYNCTCLPGFSGNGSECHECQEPLGMEKGGISDDQITASTELNNHHAIQGRLHFPESSLAGGWVAAVSDENQWLQIDLGNRFANVTGVATQGRDHHNQWVTTYNLHYGDDGASFTYYNNFTGNTDWGTVVYHEVQPPIRARYIRFRPNSWNGHVAMRVELYGCIKDEDECQNGTHNCSLNSQCINTFGSFVCTCLHGYSGDGVQCSDFDECQTGTHDCDVHAQCVNNNGSYNCTCLQGYIGDGLKCYDCYEALGMESGAIADGQITASSQWDGYHAAVQGRLHFPEAGGKAGGWAARTRDTNQWLQIDLENKYTNITRVATQGRNGANEWVTKYNLLYSDDGANFSYYVEQGQILEKDFAANTDRNTIVYHDLHPPIMARYIRFRPLAWFVHITMRAELYGCLLDEDECQSGTHNCSLNAQCINTFGSFVCTCLHGYSGDGTQCSDLDECQTGAHDCHAHAQCVNIIGAHNCTCLPGYSGDGLECYECYEALGMGNGAIADEQITASSEWDGYHAAVQGRLHFPEAGGKAGGWAARTRDTKQWLQIDLENKCSNITRVATQGRNGANEWVTEYLLQYSYDGVGFYYYGDQKQIPKKVFTGNADRNTIVYHDLNPPIQARYVRFRPLAWFTHITMRVELYGCLLDEDEDECKKETHNCDINAQCNNTIGSFNCTCLQGYLGDGVQCFDEDECRNGTQNCDVNAKCYNTIGSFTCTCLPGFSGDGVQCSDEDECQTESHNCDVNAQCNNTFGSFNCLCLQGYFGDGIQCSDKDECQSGAHNCDVNAHCNNTLGSFNCSCLRGYLGDGVQCSDEDECQGGTHNCDVNAECNNTFGSFNCTCIKGYSGDGVTCNDVNECLYETYGCDVNAQCNNTFGSFNCSCLPGYSGNGVQCSDENECQNGTHNCHVNAQCNNTIGSFHCTCLQGYTADGEQCSDIDECTIATHNCHAVAHCYNNDGSFTCECRKGYTGDGLHCDSMGDFSVTLRSISKDKYHATPVERSSKRILEAIIERLPEDVTVLESVLEWHLLNEIELAFAESAERTLVSHGTNEWTINRRSIPAGIYQVTFTASLTIRESGFQRNVNAFDYGFIEIVAAPIRAIIDDGSSVRWGTNENVTVNGSLSYDGNIGPGDRTGLNFTWSCHYSAGNTVTNECFHSFFIEVNVTSSVNINSSRLEVGKIYVIRLTVSKNERSSFAVMSFEIVDGRIPNIALRCFADCGTTISPSNKFRVTSRCANTVCNGAAYKWRLRKWNDGTKLWENLPLLPSMTSTDVNATSIVFNKNSLPTSSKLCLTLFVTPQQGKVNFAQLDFYTDGEPHGGHCNQSVTEGISLETEFSFECFGWQDERTPISYEFRLGAVPISYGFASKSVPTVLPAGSQEDDYQQQVNIVIKNSASVVVVETLDLKVKPYSGLDPCISPAKEASGKLQNLVLGDDSTLDLFLRRGEINKASQLALSVLEAIHDTKSDCKAPLDQGFKMLVLRKLIQSFTYITPESMQMSRMIMAVVNTAIEDQQGQSCDRSANTVLSNLFQDSAIKLIDETISQLLSALEDVEEPFSADLEETAASVTRCIKNVIWSASCTIQGNRASEKITAPSKEVLAEVLEKLNTMTGAFFSRLVSSETLVIKVPDLELFLKKVAAGDLEGIIIDRESARFKLPENFAVSEAGNINIKMIVIKFNPFTWDKSSELIQSSIIGLELQNSDTETIAVADLDSDIEIIIPLNRVPVNTSDTAEQSFLKPRKLSTHKYHSEIPGLPVSLKLGTQAKDITIEMLVKVGSKPTLEEFDYNFVIEFNSTRESQADYGKIDTSSPVQETSVALVPPDAGLLYVSLLFLGAKNVNEHSRKRRSCFGHGRERRSCVGVKDPPPKGVTKTVIPQYDPLTDVNYTLTIAQSSCLYWSEVDKKWTSYGCKVDPRSNSTHLMCLCNHLTFFGGSFIQAPNPIDFDKVVTELTRIDESGNISVLVSVASVFLLYFVVLIFARRADKRDAIKTCPPRHVIITEGGTYLYDLVITTGVWRNSGTTANVTISISGKMKEHNLIQLRGKGDSREMFSRGSIDGFVLVTKESLGLLTDITLEHDNSGENPSWFIETATIRDRQTDEKWVFPINRWLALEKANGEIEVTAENTSHISFSNKLHLFFGRKLVDSHLWLSVFCKPCSSPFTRVQRASCCISLLFCAMLASVMFYNISGESDGTVQVGPFKFSWRQILIGVQSGLIVAPLNILIVFLFKYSRPRGYTSYKVKGGDQIQHLSDNLREPACMLPHVFEYVGWFLCLTTNLTAASFTIFYTLLWGKEVSEQWLASTLISFSQDILVVQPTKAMMAVILIALLLSRNESHPGELHSERDDSSRISTDFLRDDSKRRLKRYKLEAVREQTKKEAQLTSMVKKIVLHVVFLFLLAVVCYGNKSENRYLMTTGLINPTKKFPKVNGSRSLGGWLRQEFLPFIYNQPWYNGVEEENELYIGNKMSILIGMPWMRQLRVKKSSCENDYHNISDCYYDYSREVEDTTLLSLPSWKPLSSNISWSEALKICPKPWRYQTAEELNRGPIRGSYNTYEGGGYPAVLGYNDDTANRVLNESLGFKWVDRQTRAVILEFTVFNANTNLISIATYFYEVLATGAAYTTRRIETLEIYRTDSGALMFYLIFQFLFLIMVLFYFIKVVIRIYRLRLGFFKHAWNMVDFLMIISSIASVAAHVTRSKSVLDGVQSIQNNPYQIVDFYSALDWTSWEDASIAVAIFMATLKLLNLIRFNPHVIFLFLSFRQSVGYQLSYACFFLIIFNAFIFSGIQFFGKTVYSYSSYIQAVVAQFEFLLGKAVPLDDLRNENPFLGPAFTFSYMLITTILFMNMIVSVLNEAYAEARRRAEENADELEMARFIGQRLDNIFGVRGRKNFEMKLFCDDSTHLNMCVSDAEPFCLNSQSICQCTKERVERLEKRIFVLSRLTKALEGDLVEEALFLDNLYSIIRPGYQITTL